MSKRHGNGVRSWKFKTGNPGPGTDRQTESQGRGGVTAYEDSVQAHTDMSMWCETALLRLTALRSVLTERLVERVTFRASCTVQDAHSDTEPWLLAPSHCSPTSSLQRHHSKSHPTSTASLGQSFCRGRPHFYF